MRETFSAGLILVLVISLFSCGPDKNEIRSADLRPNIVLIIADDLGIGSLSCYNNKVSVPTPNLDRLAGKGWQFDQFYATSPVCSPSRASILTGKTPQMMGLEKVLKPGREDEQPGEISSHTTIATVLKEAGYQTALVGKWHLGYSAEDHPTKNGFNFFAGFLNGHIDYISHTDPNGKFHLEKGGKLWKAKEKKHLTEVLTDEAIEQAQNMSASPYFMMVSYANPHAPIILPGEDAIFQNQDGIPKNTPDRYQKLVALLDKEIGKLVSTIEKEHQNTLIIFISDQGAPSELGGNFPYLGGKGNLLEGGIKVPCIFYWPGKISPQRIPDLQTSLDIFPTILSATNGSDSMLHTQSFFNSRLMPKHKINEAFTWEFRTAIAVRKENWKAVFYPVSENNPKNLKQYLESIPSSPYENWKTNEGRSYLVWLFALDKDPTEQNNLAAMNKEKVNELWMDYNTKIRSK